MSQAVPTDRSETKLRILDAAERIFARDGFDAASLRTITADAHANLAAVNYHFQTKEALFAAAIGRRVGPVNERRLKLLEAALPERSVHAILDAFVRPAMEASLAGASIRPLMARMSGVPDEMMLRIFREYLEPVLNRFVAELARVLPLIPEDELRLRMLFVVGSMAHTMGWASVAPDGRDTKNLTERLVAFATSGLNAPFAKETKQRKQK